MQALHGHVRAGRPAPPASSRVNPLASCRKVGGAQRVSPFVQHVKPIVHTDKSREVAVEAADATASSPFPTKLKPVNLTKGLAAIAIGLIIRFVIPCPAELTLQAWSLLSIFVSAIVGLVLEPLPVGAWAFCALTTAVVTKTLSFPVAFAAFRNEVIWLIVVSFFFAKGFEKTGLGERVANIFVKVMGKSTLGLAYGLVLAECVIAPAMPSTSARAGGIFMPIMKSLSENAGSYPGETAKKLGNYLVHTVMQASSFSSILFLTAAAQNLLCLDLAAQAGIIVNNPWVTWFIGAAPPSIAGLLLTPLILYKIEEPELKDTPEAPKQAEERLKQMGPMTLPQKIMAATLLGAVVLWIFGEAIGVAPVVAAMLGLCVLLFSGVLEWKDCLQYTPAWDTLTWFAILVGMSQAMNDLGIIKYFANVVGSTLTSMNLPWPALFGLLHLGFFYLHYFFASQTAHVGALYSAFLALMVAAGIPGVLAALTLAYNVNMFGAITHYASGQAAVYCGSKYTTVPGVFKVGFIIGVIGLLLYAVPGMLWWKVLGWW